MSPVMRLILSHSLHSDWKKNTNETIEFIICHMVYKGAYNKILQKKETLVKMIWFPISFNIKTTCNVVSYELMSTFAVYVKKDIGVSKKLNR